MAEMTIRLKCDLETGKKDIIVSLRSDDDDSLPHEHEQQHKQLVDKLIEGGLLAANEVGQIIVEREEEAAQQTPTSTPESEREAQSEGS